MTESERIVAAVEAVLRDSMNQFDRIPWWAVRDLRAAIGKPLPPITREKP